MINNSFRISFFLVLPVMSMYMIGLRTVECKSCIKSTEVLHCRLMSKATTMIS